MTHELPTSDLLALISEFQAVQRANLPTTPAWKAASECLQPLFAEMARRTRILAREQPPAALAHHHNHRRAP